MGNVISPRQFGEFTLRYQPPDEDVPRHSIIAEHPEGVRYSRTPGGTEAEPLGYVGSMTWHPGTHMITNIHVQEKFQRQGVATAMWEMGQATRPTPKHSGDRTDAGEAWSKAVGGSRPRRRRDILRGDT